MNGWIAIVNPAARGGRSRHELAGLLRFLRHSVDVALVSHHAGGVTSLVRQFSGAAGILVCGGDGTLFEVLQAMDRGRQRLALLPWGRGNSLGRDLGGIGLDLDDVLANGTDRAIDLMRVALRYENGTAWEGVSASNVAIGYPARVARTAGRLRRLGSYSYVLAATVTGPRYLPFHITADGEAPRDVELTGLIASNSRFIGPFLGFPQAELSDGMFEVAEMHSGRSRQMIHNVASLAGHAPLAVQRHRRLRISMPRDAVVEIDGELCAGVTDVSIQIEPSAATFRVTRH